MYDIFYLMNNKIKSAVLRNILFSEKKTHRQNFGSYKYTCAHFFFFWGWDFNRKALHVIATFTRINNTTLSLVSNIQSLFKSPTYLLCFINFLLRYKKQKGKSGLSEGSGYFS